MALSEDLINFDLIETHKENIQQLPGGRSARQLVSILSPTPSAKTGQLPTYDETKTLNDAIRQEYENELNAIADSDDPLDIYDRYVRWTLKAYPSAQATPQSQLLPLLQRATKAFLKSPDYRNDPRYLKLWLHYIRLFSDAPRETFAFLARHQVGESLGLFYEEFATWLESAGRWDQAEEVYRMGIEKEARPAEKLKRKYNQFQERYKAQPQMNDQPSSPALPTVRPALAAKIDPFAATPRIEDSQEQRTKSSTSNTSKSGKPKMAIFSDAGNDAPPAIATTSSKGWDNIGTIHERKKENTIEAKPWTGETLKAGKRVGTVPKMQIFKDSNSQTIEPKKSITQFVPKDVAVNPQTGKKECRFANLEAVYPHDGEEFSFEELRATSRGWNVKDWSANKEESPMRLSESSMTPSAQPYKSMESVDLENLSHSFQQQIEIHDTSTQSMVGMPDVQEKPRKQRRTKVREVKQETQTVKLRTESPTRPKIKRKAMSSEPTMTFHSKAATNEIYDLFNQPKKPDVSRDETQSGDDTDYGDGDGDDTYSTAGESVNTGVISGNNSELGDDTAHHFGDDDENTRNQTDSSVSPWSDFSGSGRPTRPDRQKNNGRKHHARNDSDDMTGNIDSSNQTDAFDTQAIALIANQDFGDLDTKMIAQIAGDDAEVEDEQYDENTEPLQIFTDPEVKDEIQDLKTPTDQSLFSTEFEQEHIEIDEKPRYVPIPPEDYEPTPIRPYRNPTTFAQNKLPFMTPIVERTESSLASTIFKNGGYPASTSKTPSRGALSNIDKPQDESPSKPGICDLLLRSPQQQSTSPTARTTTSQKEIDEQELQRRSPSKTANDGSPEKLEHKLPFSATKTVAANATFTDEDVFATHTQAPTVQPAIVTKARAIHKGPIVLDLQCNPCDKLVREQILNTVHPAPSAYPGWVDTSDQTFAQHNTLKAFAAKQPKGGAKFSPRKSQNEKTLTKAVPPILKFSGTSRVYAVKRELGKGAYAPVYLVDSYDPTEMLDPEETTSEEDDNHSVGSCARRALEAMKTERPPETLAWEFHILNLLRLRLGQSARAMASIVKSHECHIYRDESYLLLDYHSQGTLLDLINLVRTDNARAGKMADGVDETVAMWLSVELLRTMEEFHKIGILHGDLKVDNCLVRLGNGTELEVPYNRYGDDGWCDKGLLLIDLGRGIDVRAFKPEARFVADWAAEETDCAEIREARPWKYQIDLFGAAGVIHSLLFGKYIDTVAVSSGGLGQKKEWKLKENLKRYWEKEIWSEVFSILINGGSMGEDEMRKEVARIRGLMEAWLEQEGERGGRDLRGQIRRCERLLGVGVAKNKAGR